MQKKIIQNIPDKDNVICSWDEEGGFHFKILKWNQKKIKMKLTVKTVGFFFA